MRRADRDSRTRTPGDHLTSGNFLTRAHAPSQKLYLMHPDLMAHFWSSKGRNDKSNFRPYLCEAQESRVYTTGKSPHCNEIDPKFDVHKVQTSSLLHVIWRATGILVYGKCWPAGRVLQCGARKQSVDIGRGC